MKHNYKLIIFDMDGTLVDTERLYVKSLEMACKERGFSLNDEQASKIIYGKAWSCIFKDLKKITGRLFSSIEELQKCCSLHFERMLESQELEIKSSVKLLRQLAQDTQICIVSGSSREHIAYFIESLDISNEVDFYLGSEDYEIGKPDPQCFLKAAQHAAVEAAQCLVFEDSNAGVSAAKNAGMDCVGLKSPQNPQNISHADLIVSCLSQFSFQLLNQKTYQ